MLNKKVGKTKVQSEKSLHYAYRGAALPEASIVVLILLSTLFIAINIFLSVYHRIVVSYSLQVAGRQFGIQLIDESKLKTENGVLIDSQSLNDIRQRFAAEAARFGVRVNSSRLTARLNYSLKNYPSNLTPLVLKAIDGNKEYSLDTKDNPSLIQVKEDKFNPTWNLKGKIKWSLTLSAEPGITTWTLFPISAAFKNELEYL